MFPVLFVLFIVLPIIEIAILLEVGALIGFWPTLAVIVATAWVGAKQVRLQGIKTLESVQQKLNNGEMPSDEIVAGLMVLVSGVLLVTPGFVTDIVGLLLLWPVSRLALAKMVRSRLAGHIHIHAASQGNFQQFHQHHGENHQNAQSRAGTTLEGEYEEKK